MKKTVPDLRRLRTAALLGLLALPMACSGGGAGGAADQPESLVATATVLPGACPSGAGPFPNTTCMVLRIQGQGNASIEVETRIIEPPAQASLIGTVLLGTGGEGTTFYSQTTGGELLIGDLLTAGFRVVDRRWVNGWFSTGEGIRQQSARYASLLTWVHDNVHTTGSFNLCGNSGGASEIAYALTTWGRSSLVDRAVMTSGPPLARLDYLCENPASVEWSNICTTIVPAGVMDCGVPLCIPDLNPLCPVLPGNPQPGELEADSILHPGAVLDFPDTELIVLLGADDCSSAVPLSLLFFDSLVSAETLAFAPGTPHLFGASVQGRAAVFDALTGTAPAPSPAPQLLMQYTATSGAAGETRTLFGALYEGGSDREIGRISSTRSAHRASERLRRAGEGPLPAPGRAPTGVGGSPAGEPGGSEAASDLSALS